MPRYQVRPEERRRSSHACGACKTSKKACDSQLPCSSCAKKGIASTCTYSARRARPSTRFRPQRSPAVRRTTLSEQPTTTYPNSNSNSNSKPDARGSSPAVTQHPRMLLGGRGEKVYIGNTAAISFLHFLRKTLRRYAGPSAFTETQKRHLMLEATVQTNSSANFEDDLEDSEKIALIQYFLQASSGLLYLYTDEGITQLLASATAGTKQDDLASLYLMIAIGAQCRSNEESDLQCSAKYFSQAQQMAFRDKLYDPSLSMITNFLLMAFYMFCACRRNTALMYLGVASQAATILGLHLPELNNTLPPESRGLRVRTWKSLRILDLLCNAILGRPSSTPHIQREETHGVSEENTIHRMRALNANFDSCSIIETISHVLTKQNSLDTDTAENFLQMLRGWAQALPEELRQSVKKGNGDTLDRGHREFTIGNIHVACSYYFGVILVTRQFLVATVTPKLRRQHSGDANPGADAPDSTVDSQKASQLSQACIGAATYLVQICHDAAMADLLLGNMCILQAWVFAAGLVLGFSLLVQLEIPHPEARGAFAASREVLGKLSRLSPQAKRYYEILSSFCEAIESYQNQLHRDRQQAGNAYLEQILKLDVNSSSVSQPEAGAASSGANPTAVANDEWDMLPPSPLGPLDGFPRSPTPPQMMVLTPEVSDEIGFQLLWDEYAPQFAAQVPASTEPFAQVPWGHVNVNMNWS